ncbi:MAG TPA: prolipoprotein diacylglyceryl transferase [Chloroflexia bacterium]|nr:prolipoprotein diacylglyceryl transferase [Chloroflexia bacterium]
MASVSVTPARKFKLSKFILSWYGILIVYALVIGLFLILRAQGGNNPIALQIGGLTFRWYGVIITSGVIIASFLAQFLAERRGDDPDHVWRLLPIVLVAAIVCARIWYVVNTWDSYKNYLFDIGNPVHPGAVEIWRGGIAIQGAVVGGILGGLVYGFFWNRGVKGKKLPFSIWRFADYVAPGLVLAQAIGRWGNFMNNEAYGRETKYPWGIKIPCEYRTSGATPGTNDTLCPGWPMPNGQPKVGGIDKDALFHPTFLYESLWDYFTFLVLFYCIMKPKTIERRFKVKLRDGDIFLLYWVVYSIGRFFTEGLRTDSLYFGGDVNGLRTAQVLAIISILVAGFLLFYRHRNDFPVTQRLSMRLAPVGATVAIAGAGAVADGVSGVAAADDQDVTGEDNGELDSVEVENNATTPTEVEVSEAEPVQAVNESDDDSELDTPATSTIEPALSENSEVTGISEDSESKK